ncbi:HUWE1-associated protein modifying stress responses-like [Antedon mediterranea]|uniref:HUWE1-associated protein modifying stress responses-like n=1 Tax=Antedon mediterranea TaxID=105859 RepID=UPI003AF5F37A
MSEHRDRGEDSGSDFRASNWEQHCLDILDGEPNLDDERLPQEKQIAFEQLWYSFQACASAVTQLYKDRHHNNDSGIHWINFQNAAAAVTALHKESMDMYKRGMDMGLQAGYQRRTRDIAGWAKKRRRLIKREDLLSYMCGKPAPPRHRPPQVPRTSMERSSPRLHSPPRESLNQADDGLQAFRDALALQGLSGAMADVQVNVSQSPPHGRRRHANLSDYFYDELLSPNQQDSRKRSNSSNDVHMDSPTHKKNRLI